MSCSGNHAYQHSCLHLVLMPSTRVLRKNGYLARSHGEALLHEGANVVVIAEAGVHAHHSNAPTLHHQTRLSTSSRPHRGSYLANHMNC